MVSHHPAKFGCHRRFGSGGIMFLVAEEVNTELRIISNNTEEDNTEIIRY